MAKAPVSSDLAEAKRVLSARLLRAGFRSDVAARSMTFSVQAAVADASRNVHAVGIGTKIVNGAATDDMVVRFYVVQKLALSLLPPRDRLPTSVDGLATDVVESAPAMMMAKRPLVQRPGAVRARATAASAVSFADPPCTGNRRLSQRPLLAGISVAHRDVTAGTIGYFCRSTRAGDDPDKIHILSNNHVLAFVNQASFGDDVYQRAPADGGTVADHVADVRRFVPMDVSGAPNKVDAAIAELLPGVAWRPEICTIGGVSAVAKAEVGMTVRKHGRTSGYTEGQVSDASYDAVVSMGPNVSAVFEDQIRIEAAPPYQAFGLGGDSGSLVVSRGAQTAIGLYFAGPPSGYYGLANKIEDVISEMEINLVDPDVA